MVKQAVLCVLSALSGEKLFCTWGVQNEGNRCPKCLQNQKPIVPIVPIVPIIKNILLRTVQNVRIADHETSHFSISELHPFCGLLFENHFLQ